MALFSPLPSDKYHDSIMYLSRPLRIILNNIITPEDGTGSWVQLPTSTLASWVAATTDSGIEVQLAANLRSQSARYRDYYPLSPSVLPTASLEEPLKPISTSVLEDCTRRQRGRSISPQARPREAQRITPTSGIGPIHGRKPSEESLWHVLRRPFRRRDTIGQAPSDDARAASRPSPAHVYASHQH